MYLDLLTSNGLIIKRRYYDFNDSIPIVNISVEITRFNMVDHTPFNRNLNLIHSDILCICI